MAETKILIVDDKENIREVLSEILKTEGYSTVMADSGESGLISFQEETPDFILTDMVMKELSGVDFIREVRKLDTRVPIIILTAYGTISSAVEAMKAGADDYMTKPLNYDLLKMKIRKILDEKTLEKENSTLKDNLKKKWGLDSIIGRSAVMEKMFTLIESVAPTNSSVLVQGEGGTGKELIAKSLHSKSSRVGAPFVVVDCSAIPENLIESELFGYEKGAFSGAETKKKGRIEEAQSGTLFLDEIGELPLSCQAKFLRVIQERQFVRVGGNNQVHVDFRLIAATNKNLKEEVKKGRFRSDLYYRLNVISIESPPLRQRREDIPLLAEVFLKDACRENGITSPGLERELLSALMNYSWPGNVRELKNSIQRYAILGSLPDEIANAPAPDGEQPGGNSLFDNEKELVKQALKDSEGNITRAAAALGIGRKALYNRIRKYDLTVPKGTELP
jgi:two-component system NtrC family response regulator/two-component system response regulator AtoC